MRRRLRVLGHVMGMSLRADPKVAAVITVIVVLQAASITLLALAQRWVVDTAGIGIVGGLVAAALLGAVAHAAAFTGNRIQNNLRIDLAERVDLTLTAEVLALASRMPTIEHLERPEYLDRLTALRTGTRELAASCWSAAETAASMVSLAASMWLLASVHPALACLTLLGVPPLLLARRGQHLVRHTVDACAEQVRHEHDLHELCVQPEPAKEVRIAGNGPELSRRAYHLWRDTTRREARARVRGAVWEMAGWLCYAAGFVVAIVVVASLAASNAVTLGTIVLVISIGSRLRLQLAATVFGINQLGAAGHVTTHYLWLRDYAATHPAPDVAPPTRLTDGITMTNVDFHYPGARAETLHDITLHLPAGSTVGLVGANGAGKSTLIKLLAGLYRPSSGEITVDGQPLSTLDPAAWTGRLSGAFQDFVKLQARCGESIGAGDPPRMRDEAAIRAAVGRAGAGTVVDTLPDGLSTMLGRTFDGVDLSHGQWQKLALARGMMRDEPLLLVLDEPTAALDPQAEHDLFERFTARARAAAHARGAITVLVSHRFSTVHMADRIVVLDNGRIVEHGSHADLMAADGQYADLYRTQAAGYA